MTICGYYWQRIIAYQLAISPQSSQSAQRTHRVFLREFPAVSSIAILAGLWAAAPGCRSTVAALPGTRLRSFLPPEGRAVRGCCAVVRAGWLG